jgi:hypothetical protein
MPQFYRQLRRGGMGFDAYSAATVLATRKMTPPAQTLLQILKDAPIG